MGNIQPCGVIIKANTSRLEHQAEQRVYSSQELRASSYHKLSSLHQRLETLRQTIIESDRTSEKYLGLVSSEHRLLIELKQVKKESQDLEELERSNFMKLSNALRDSHEKERLRNERSKYISIIFSTLGTFVGMIFGYMTHSDRTKLLGTIFAQNNDICLQLEAMSHQISHKFSILQENIGNLKNVEEDCDDDNQTAKIIQDQPCKETSNICNNAENSKMFSWNAKNLLIPLFLSICLISQGMNE
ncbi:MAG: Coiled-coil domain-containing protein 51 [Marteilia pararefringens]